MLHPSKSKRYTSNLITYQTPYFQFFQDQRIQILMKKGRQHDDMTTKIIGFKYRMYVKGKYNFSERQFSVGIWNPHLTYVLYLIIIAVKILESYSLTFLIKKISIMSLEYFAITHIFLQDVFSSWRQKNTLQKRNIIMPLDLKGCRLNIP